MGSCLKLLEPVVKITSGGALYSGNPHQKSMLDLINTQLFGIMHSGQIGDVIIGTFYSSLDINKPFTSFRWSIFKSFVKQIEFRYV